MENDLEHKAAIDAKKYESFLQHKCKYDPKKTDAAGGRFSYIYRPNGIFTGLTVRCLCGKSKDITDYSKL